MSGVVDFQTFPAKGSRVQPALGAHVLHVGAARFADAQPEQAEHRDQGGLVGGGGAGGRDQGSELHPVQAQDLGLLGTWGRRTYSAGERSR